MSFIINFITFLAVQCNIPEDPINGRALYTSVVYNSQVKYECRYGYKLNVGLEMRKCGANKQWEGETPKCQGISCCRVAEDESEDEDEDGNATWDLCRNRGLR